MGSIGRYRSFEKPQWGRNNRMKNGRNPLDPRMFYLPFKETAPFALKNSVLGAGKNVKESPCIPQMMKLFECLVKNEYNQENCGQHVLTFQECFNGHLSRLEAKKKGLVTSEPVPGVRRLPTDQLNTLLRRHPQRNN